MGYVIKNIANITEPKELTLSAVPNFIQFSSKARVPVAYHATVQVLVVGAPIDRAVLEITETGGAVHSFAGTLDPEEADGATFLIAASSSDTAENLRRALLSDSWIAANFEVRIGFNWLNGVPSPGNTLDIVGRGYSEDYNATISAPNDTTHTAFVITPISSAHSGDTISGEASTIEIEIDVYRDPPTTLGKDSRPDGPDSLGDLLISLQKTYGGLGVWFDLNTLFDQFGKLNTPAASGWFDTGTLSAYRIVAKTISAGVSVFYISDALYVINGYSAISDAPDMSQYGYQDTTVKLLTNKPVTPYVRGQKEFLNFILRNPFKGSAVDTFTLGVLYRAYSTGGTFLGAVTLDEQDRETFNSVNTCVLRIDEVLDAYPTAGRITAALSRGGAVVSNALEYEVRPDCLHDLQQFHFLNKLGGWDTFNFDTARTDDYKPKGDTYRRTVTPEYDKARGIEALYTANLDDTYTVQGAPITDEVAEWLKEFAASQVIIDASGRYILLTDFSMQQGDYKAPTFKYRLSETYTNDD